MLGTAPETETIERALDLVVFGERLSSGTARARGRAWNDVVGEMDRIVPTAGSRVSIGCDAPAGA
jgi:hypothetical protein